MAQMRRVTVMIDLNEPVVHHHKIYAGIQQYAEACGHWECSVTPFAELLLLHSGQKTRTDGIIARATPLLAKRALKARVPVVNVWLNSPVRGLPAVVHDAEEAGRMAARHLMARGFRTFGFIGFSNDRSSQLELKGFCATLAQTGWPCSECWADIDYSFSARNWKHFQKILGRWIASWTPPIGIFVSHDLLCRYVAEACRLHKLNVPADAALVGCCNETVVSAHPAPSLSSIEFGFERVGYRAAELLNSLMDGTAAPKDIIRLPPIELLARQSSDAFAVENPVVSQAMRYIAENAHNSVGVDQVASHVNTTRRTLARLFAKFLGKSVYETMTHLRLERVKRQLSESGRTLKTIAVECGFSDAIHLSKVFHRIEGITPGEYRLARSLHNHDATKTNTVPNQQ